MSPSVEGKVTCYKTMYMYTIIQLYFFKLYINIVEGSNSDVHQHSPVITTAQDSAESGPSPQNSGVDDTSTPSVALKKKGKISFTKNYIIHLCGCQIYTIVT